MASLVPKHRTDPKGRKVIKGYYAEFYDPQRRPIRKRVTLRTKDKAAARQKLVYLERQYMAGDYDPWTEGAPQEGITFAEAAAQFLEVKRKKQLRAKSITNYADILRLLEQHLPPRFPVAYTEERHIVGMLEARTLSDTSQATYLRHLRSFFRWAKTEGLTKHVPVPVIERHRKQTKVAEFLTRDEVDRLVRHIESEAILKATQLRREGGIVWLADLIRFAVGTGLRMGELCGLRWADVDRSTHFITVRRSKSHRQRRVYITGEARAVLDRRHDARTTEANGYVFTGVNGRKLNGNYASQCFRRYRDEVGLPDSLHFHSLRHTFASWAVLDGMDLYRLRDILGHADLSQTMRYAHLRPEAQINDMERIFGTTGEANPATEEARLQAQIRHLEAELERLKTPSQEPS